MSRTTFWLSRCSNGPAGRQSCSYGPASRKRRCSCCGPTGLSRPRTQKPPMPKLVVDGLGKRYRLEGGDEAGGPLEFVRRLRARLQRAAAEPAESATPTRDFWALKDVSFTVDP